MYDVTKPRYRVDEPVYVKMKWHRTAGYIRDIGRRTTYLKGRCYEEFIYIVFDLDNKEIYEDRGIGAITDKILVERWEVIDRVNHRNCL